MSSPPASSTQRPRVPVGPWAVLALAMAATLVVSVYLAVEQRRANQDRFATMVTEIQSDIMVRIEAYVATLRAGAALFGASRDVTRAEFAQFARSLQLQQRYPGIQGIGFSAHLLPHELEPWLARMRSEGLPDIRVWPAHPRDEYHAVGYLEPLDRRNAAAIGFDMFTEPTRRAAMERARDTGDAAATGRVFLVQEIDEQKQPGMLIYVPVYRDASAATTVADRRRTLVGFVYAPFRAGDLLSGIFADAGDRAVAFRLYDDPTADDEHLLYDSRAGSAADAGGPAMTTSRPLVIAGRTFVLQFEATDAFVDADRQWPLPWLAGLVGTLVSLALFGMSRAQVRARLLAEDRAGQLQASEQALRRSESRFRRVVDANIVGVAFSHIDGRVFDANDAACRIYGRTRDEVLAGKLRWDEATPPEHLGRDAEAARECRETGVCTPFEKDYIRPDGTRVPILLGAALLEGSDSEFVALMLDLTERKRAEAAMRTAREAAETASRMKDEFLATVSHELRTPLNAMLGWTQLLRAAPPRDPADLQRALETIERNARAQAQLIEDLLDVSRIVSGKMRLSVKPIDLTPVMRAALESVEPAAIAKGVRLVRDLGEGPRRVLGDPVRLQQVFWNLLSNAIKFTPHDGTVAITLVDEPNHDGAADNTTATADTGHIVVTVRDTGIGIEPDFLPHVFERFTQADPSPTRRHGGLGLGLGIVRHLTEMHGGTVDAHSDGRDRGTTFRVRLPAVRATDDGAAPREVRQVVTPQLLPDAQPLPLAAARVLVVDDDPDALELLAQVLQNKGATVTRAASVTAALLLVDDATPDLLISDLAMPDADGFDLLRRLRQRPGQRDHPTPAIAVTAYARQQDRERSLRAGFQFHLPKPIQPDELIRVAATLLGRDA